MVVGGLGWGGWGGDGWGGNGMVGWLACGGGVAVVTQQATNLSGSGSDCACVLSQCLSMTLSCYTLAALPGQGRQAEEDKAAGGAVDGGTRGDDRKGGVVGV